MGNSIFRFKKFSINQESIGMKITADACLFATLIDVERSQRILDIGSGTGLLSLMLAQRNRSAQITALEIDKYAHGLTIENFQNSPWHNRLQGLHLDFRNFETQQKFDLIVCNPPFFKNQSKSTDKKRRLAFHQDTYSLGAYFRFCAHQLTPAGVLYLLYPTNQLEQVKSEAILRGFHLNEVIYFKGKEAKESHCTALKLSRINQEFSSSELICRNNDNSYSPAYEALLKPFQIIF